MELERALGWESEGLVPSVSAISLSCDKAADFPGPRFPHLKVGTRYPMPAYPQDYEEKVI